MERRLKQIILNARKYYPPFKNTHFWTVQLLAIPIAIISWVLINTEYFSHFQGLFFIPITLQVLPVIYAALTFGFAGSVSTAVWVVILCIPNLVMGPGGLERVGVILQLIILVTLAIFIGQKVDRETISRKKHEDANAALVSSEIKYRGLFDFSPLPILLLDKDNRIIDANPAGSVLLKSDPVSLKGKVADEVGIKCVFPGKQHWWECQVVTTTAENSGPFLAPSYSLVKDPRGNEITQVILRDITQEYNRQEGLKAYTAYILRAQEEERQRIARELHDETIQSLALLMRQLDDVESKSSGLSSAFTEELGKARKIAEKAVVDLRNFTRALRPPILDDLGVVASIRRLVVDFTERTGVKGQFSLIGEEKRVSRETEVGIYRIAQEALWNVEHHAKAKSVNVRITFREKDIVLNVADDGIGFDVPVIIGIKSAASRLGLVGMQERAEIFGGRLDIASRPGKGTVVTTYIPIPDNELKNG
jgi:signal transduction histidine kinase